MSCTKSTASLKINSERCAGCGMCRSVCPHAVIAIENNKAVVRRLDSCMECGACRMNCPFGAIDVKAGVGCASAIFRGMITGRQPTCGCSCDSGPEACC